MNSDRLSELLSSHRPLVEQALKGLPRSIKLYGSNSVEGLLLDIREVKPLATDDWKLIEKIISNQKNN